MAAFPDIPAYLLKPEFVVNALKLHKPHMSVKSQVNWLSVERHVPSLSALAVKKLQSPSPKAMSLKSWVHCMEKYYRNPTVRRLTEQRKRQPMAA